MLSTVEKLLFLKGIDLFQTLSNEVLVQIAQIAEEQVIEEGEVLMKEGDMGETLYITLSGTFRITKAGAVLNELGSKEVLGEMAILDSAPRSATITAASDGSVLRLERGAFHELMAERQEIAQGIIRVLIQRLRHLSEIKSRPEEE